ncbi:hypothetical protein ABBQ32_002779 [Trebouxia sp. C0010 RCD-2024]
MVEIITNAIYLEERATGAAAHRLKVWEQQQTQSSCDPVERITKSMDPSGVDDHGAPQQLQQTRPKEYGHHATDCKQSTATTKYASADLLETHTCNLVNNYPEADDSTPSTPEAELYAAGGRTGPMRRAPKHRAASTPEGIQAARDARAKRGNSAARDSGAGPTQHQPLGQAHLPQGHPNPITDPKYHCHHHQVTLTGVQTLQG